MNILYLASASKSRQNLLKTAGIPFKVVEHTSDEDICNIDPHDSFNDYVLAIAKHKMDHVVMPTNKTTAFVLTADTLMRTAKSKKILGKPKDAQDAKRMLKMLCGEEIELATGCCLEKRELKDGAWVTSAKEHWVTPATLEFCVDEKSVDLYLEKMPHALYACGAGIIEDFGLNFLKRINGSFSSVMGLPLFELREKLKKIGFNSGRSS